MGNPSKEKLVGSCWGRVLTMEYFSKYWSLV